MEAKSVLLNKKWLIIVHQEKTGKLKINGSHLQHNAFSYTVPDRAANCQICQLCICLKINFLTVSVQIIEGSFSLKQNATSP